MEQLKDTLEKLKEKFKQTLDQCKKENAEKETLADELKENAAKVQAAHAEELKQPEEKQAEQEQGALHNGVYTYYCADMKKMTDESALTADVLVEQIRDAFEFTVAEIRTIEIDRPISQHRVKPFCYKENKSTITVVKCNDRHVMYYCGNLKPKGTHVTKLTWPPTAPLQPE